MVKTHGIWDEHALELVFLLVKSPCFKRHLNWKANPFVVKHDELGGSSTVDRTLNVFSQRFQGGNKGHAEDGVKSVLVLQGPPLGDSGVHTRVTENVDAKCCLISPVIYHGDGFYPGDTSKLPLFMVRSCRVSLGWCKRRLRTPEVLCLYDISDTVYHSLTSTMKRQFLATANLTPVRMLFTIFKTVLEVLLGGSSSRNPAVTGPLTVWERVQILTSNMSDRSRCHHFLIPWSHNSWLVINNNNFHLF
jgi:hypothetical protein